MDVAGLDHAVVIQFSGVARNGAFSVSQHALMAALHIDNIDFELN